MLFLFLFVPEEGTPRLAPAFPSLGMDCWKGCVRSGPDSERNLPKLANPDARLA